MFLEDAAAYTLAIPSRTQLVLPPLRRRFLATTAIRRKPGGSLKEGLEAGHDFARYPVVDRTQAITDIRRLKILRSHELIDHDIEGASMSTLAMPST